MTTKQFTSLTLAPELIKNLDSLGYQHMTDIQAQSLPHILSGKDIIAQGQTGSGKTAAFSLGILAKLRVKRFRIQAMVLCPTRELADQVAKEIRKLARTIHNIKVLTLCGGTPVGPQIGSLEHGAHIIVGTPGRIEDHINKGRLNLNEVDMLVLDEADRMLDMGFQDALDYIIEQLPAQRQTLLFSATYPKNVNAIANRVLTKPVSVKAEAQVENSNIEQKFFNVDNNEQRLEALQLLLLKYRPESSVVFCNTKKETQEVADKLLTYGFSVVALHGDLEQRDRDQTLVRFANKSASILVATDVAARGLDIANLDAVFNYHIAHDTETHIHRIGRTGRAGNSGMACSFYSEKERYKVGLLEDYLDQKITPELLPDPSQINSTVFNATMTTLQIDGGKKQKVRAGDILGALTKDQAMAGSDVGKIQLGANWAYVAIAKNQAKKALKLISNGKIKGRSFRVREIN